MLQARDYYIEAITKFETDDYKITEADDPKYVDYSLYYSKAYRGLATTYIKESFDIELLLGIVDKFGQLSSAPDGTNLLDFLYSDLYPDEAERNQKINDTYKILLPRYSYEQNDKTYYYYEEDVEDIDKPLGERRGAFSELLDKSSQIASTALTNVEGIASEDDRDKLSELTVNGSFDAMISGLLSTLFVAMDSNFNFEVNPVDANNQYSTTADLFSIELQNGSIGFVSPLLETISTISTGLAPENLSASEAEGLIEKLDYLAYALPNLTNFLGAMLGGTENLALIIERIPAGTLPEEFSGFINIIIPEDKTCTDEASQSSIYCTIKGIGGQLNVIDVNSITKLISALKLVVRLSQLNDAFDPNNIDTENTPSSIEDVIDLMGEDEAAVVNELFNSDESGNGACMDNGEVNLDKEECGMSIDIGALTGGEDSSGETTEQFTEVNNVLNEYLFVYDKIGSTETPTGTMMTPAKGWKALAITTECKTTPDSEDCKYLDDISAVYGSYTFEVHDSAAALMDPATYTQAFDIIGTKANCDDGDATNNPTDENGVDKCTLTVYSDATLINNINATFNDINAQVEILNRGDNGVVTTEMMLPNKVWKALEIKAKCENAIANKTEGQTDEDAIKAVDGSQFYDEIIGLFADEVKWSH